jgi:hypothetical protein
MLAHTMQAFPNYAATKKQCDNVSAEHYIHEARLIQTAEYNDFKQLYDEFASLEDTLPQCDTEKARCLVIALMEAHEPILFHCAYRVLMLAAYGKITTTENAALLWIRNNEQEIKGHATRYTDHGFPA